MILDNIDYDKKYEYTLVLTKKNKKAISILYGLSNRTLDRTMDGIDKLSFNISYYVDDQFTQERIKNPTYDKVIEENMILLKCGDASEPIFESYFIIKNITESSDKMSKQVECSSRQVMLNKNTVTLNGIERQLKKDDVNIADGIFDILEQETTWKLGYLDPQAKVENIPGINANKYRWFDALSAPWLQFLNDNVASAFNLVLFYDTVNKRINVYNRDNFGVHTGIILSEENYIKNLSKKSSSENIVTKLEASGRDGLDFSEVNPLGTTYILNYDYFRQNGQMSDELIAALDKYDILLNAKNIEFQNLRSQIDTLNASKIVKQGEMNTLNEELVALRHIQSGYMSSNDNINLPTATTNVNNKVIQIANKKAEVDSINSQISTINSQVAAISNAIDKKNAKDTNNNLIFDEDLLEELEDFTYTESWDNSYYNNATLLLNGAKEVLKDWSVPPIEFDMNLIDFFGYVKAQNYWNKINLGDFVRVFSSKFNTNVDVRIIGYSYNIDSNDLKITFSNKNKKLDDVRGVGGTIKRSAESSKIVNVKKLEWDKIKDTKNSVDTFLNNDLEVSRQNIISRSAKNKIDITEYGMFVIDADDENHQLAILSGIIGFTSDGWQTCNTALDNTGIYAKYLVGQIILGEELFIQNTSNTFKVDKDGVFITNSSQNFVFDKNGFVLKDSQYKTLISPQGVASTDNLPFLDSVDSDTPMVMDFFIDDNVNVIDKVILKLSVQDYRAYSKSASSGGGSTSSSGGGGTSSSGGGGTSSASRWDDYTSASNVLYLVQNTQSGEGVYVKYEDFKHNHTISNHSHTIYSHTHTVPDHSHGLIYGIYTRPKTINTMNIYVDGVLRTNVSSEKNIIDLTSFVSVKGWHQIVITSSDLNRFACSVYLKTYIGA